MNPKRIYRAAVTTMAHSNLRTAVAAALTALLTPCLLAQISNLTEQTSTPIPGAGHDYIHLLSDTVNLASGTVSIRIAPPMPKGRLLNLPFSFSYDSGSAIQLTPETAGSAQWATDSGYLSQGGWNYSVPNANMSNWSYTGMTQGGNQQNYMCYYTNGVMYRDSNGGAHSLQVGVGDSNMSGGFGSYLGCVPSNSEYIPNSNGTWPAQNGGDSQVSAHLICPPRTTPCQYPTLTVSDADGTVYYFGILSHAASGLPNVFYGLAGSIEDRNGNRIGLTYDNPLGTGAFQYTDTLGRAIISSSGFGPVNTTNTVTLADLTYSVTWRQTTSNYRAGYNQINSFSGVSCGLPSESNQTSQVNENQVVIDHITLPNGQIYQFYYGDNNPDSTFDNPYGLISEIVYPNGGWVKYKWGLPTNSQGSSIMTQFIEFDGYVQNGTPHNYPFGCQFQYQAPVLLSRTVGYTSSPTPALTQTFAYQVKWNPNSYFPNSTWTTKVTTVTDADPIYGTKNTVYTYSSVGQGSIPTFSSTPYGSQIPVEQTVQHYDWGNTTTAAETTTEAWLDQYTLLGERTQFWNFQPKTTSYCYTGQPCTKSGFMQGSGTPIAQLHETDEYDFGASSPTRWTVNSYQPFSGAPGTIADRPCKTVIYGTGVTAETDNYFDGGTSLCNEPTTLAPVSSVNNLPTYTLNGNQYSTHDETTFGTSYKVPRGNLTKQVKIASSGSQATTTYQYDETGQLASLTDPCGNASCGDMQGTSTHQILYSFTDNPSGGNTAGNSNAYLTSITDQLQHVKQFSYNYITGDLTRSKDVNNNTTTNYQYDTRPSQCSQQDTLDRLSEIDYPDGGITEYCYNDTVPSVETAVLITGSTWKEDVNTMDGLGHVIQASLISDPNGADTVETTYDSEGQVYTKTNPHRSYASPTDGTSTFYYDALGRKVEQKKPDGGIRWWCYDDVTSKGQPNCNGRIAGGTGEWVDAADENGNDWQDTTDGLGRLTSVREPSGGSGGTGMVPTLETDYSYDALSNLLSVVQWGGTHGSSAVRSRFFTYDNLSRLIQSFNPEVGWICYGTTGGAAPNGSNCTRGYDGNSNLAYKTDARNVVTNYLYDPVNRVLSKRFSNDPSNTPSSCYQYDLSYVGLLTHQWTQRSSAGACPTSPPATGLLTRRSFLQYDAMGRIQADQQCTSTNCSSGGPYYAPAYTFYLSGDVQTFSNGITTTPTIGTLSFTNAFDGAERLLRLTSNWNDSAHPATLFSAQTGQTMPCASSLSADYAPPGGLWNAAFGNGALTLNRVLDNRLRTVCEVDKGMTVSSSTPASTTVTVTGMEQSK